MKNNKHAYLIMTHNELYILEKLLLLLDNKRNDIYIHVDKKLRNFDFDYYRSLIKYSNLIFIKRMDVRWGTNGQVECVYNLLKESIKQNYSYYHLISGVDLPLKSQGEIHNFFDNLNDKNLVMFDDSNDITELGLSRIKYYYFFGKCWRSKFVFVKKVSNKLRVIFLKIQKKLKINRLKNQNYKFRKGPNWFSINNDLAHYIVENKKFKELFKRTYCADELYVQTLVYNSKFKDTLYSNKDNDYDSIKRYIDWTRGNPYTFKEGDFEELFNSNMLFARKFSSKVDKKIIDNIYNKLR